MIIDPDYDTLVYHREPKPTRTLRQEIEAAAEEAGDEILVLKVAEPGTEDQEFNGHTQWEWEHRCVGPVFTAWGDKYVFFPLFYDGQLWVGWAPRNPCDEVMAAQGGG